MKNRTMLLLMLTMVCALSCLSSGCAAVYTYSHETAAGDKCHVGIMSRREVGGPVSFEADKDCGVKAGTGNLSGGQLSTQEMGALNSLLLKLIAPQLGAPAIAAPAEQPKQ